MPSRRAWLIGGAALGAGGAGFLLFERESTYTLGPPRLVAPLLRSSQGGPDRVFALAARPETELRPGIFGGSHAIEGTRYELRGYDPAAFSAYRFNGELEFTDVQQQRWVINSRDFRAYQGLEHVQADWKQSA